MSDEQFALAPNSVEAEEALLGSVLLDASLLDDLIGQVEPEDFFIVRNSWVWEAMLCLHARDEGIDYVTVVEELRRQKRLDEIGGAAYITYLINHTPASIYAGAYAAVVGRASFRRQAQRAASDIAQAAQAAGTVEDLRGLIDETFMRLLEAAPGEDTFLRGRDALAYYAEVLQARTDVSSPDLLSLPWEGFARQVPGIKPGRVVLVSGFSGQGKTLFLEGLSDWWAMLGHKVFFITTELTREDMLDRMVCRHTGLPYSEVVARSADAQRIMRSFSREVAHWLPNIDYWETNGANAKAIYGQIRRAIKKGRLIIFIDYLSEAVGFDTKGRELKDAIDGFFRALHSLAKQTGANFFIASQQSDTDRGPRVFGSSIPNQKAALHIRLETQKATSAKMVTVDDRLVTVRDGDPDPFMLAVIEKNNFGALKPDVRLFKDGARFRFLDESEVSATQAYSDHEIDKAAEAHEKQARTPKQIPFGTRDA